MVVVRHVRADRRIGREIGHGIADVARDGRVIEQRVGHGDAVAQHGEVVSVGILEVSVVDHRVRLGIRGRDVDAAAASRRDARNDDPDAPVQLVRLVRRQHGEQMEVEEAVGRLRRDGLAERLLLGQEARSGGRVDIGLEIGADRAVNEDERVVVEVGADAGQVEHRLDARSAQALGIADAGALQDQRRAVGAGGQHQRAGHQLVRCAIADRVDDDALVGLLEAVDERAVEDRQVRQVAHRIEVGERGVPARAADHVDGLEAEAVVGVEIAEVRRHPPAEPAGGLEAVAVERHGLLVGVCPHAHLLDDGGEQRRDVVARPAGQAPGVVVHAMADCGDRAVVRRAPADHSGPLEGPATIAARVAPVVREGERRGVDEIDRPAGSAVRAVVGSGLDEDHIAPGLGEPRRDGRPGGSAADHDDVRGRTHGATSSQSVVPHVIARKVQS